MGHDLDSKDLEAFFQQDTHCVPASEATLSVKVPHLL